MSLTPRRTCTLALTAVLSLPFFAPVQSRTLLAQTVSGASTVTGTVADPGGNMLATATVLLKSDAGSFTRKATADSTGHFSIGGVPAGVYTVSVSAPGFSIAVQQGVRVLADQPKNLAFSLSLGNFSQQVTVDGGGTTSIAAQLAPMDAPLDERSARTEVNTTFIQNYTAPTADFGELVALVPGTETTNANGVGLGQSNTSFRGFADGDYDIDFDGIPFYDTNTPSHHSWAFFPSQWIGGVDFDRSPGTASTIGPTPFGGSIHLLSKQMPSERNINGGISYGSFNTFLFDGNFNSGDFGGASKKSNLFVDVHHMSSDGYQTFNYQSRNAGSLKYQYRLSDKTVLTGFSGVIWLDANTPNLSSLRSQIIAHGDNYLMQNTDTTQANYYKYNHYHVPTDFEYVGINSQLAHSWSLDFKPYTYNYDNAEFYGKQPKGGKPIDPTHCLPVASNATEGIAKVPEAISPCAVDKYNSYRKYGETLAVSQTSSHGIFRTGIWYEWAATNRHQFPSNPFTLKDDVLPNFSEKFWTNSYQPYGEYEWMATKKLSITAGLKFAFYTMDLTQFADNNGKIGSVNPITGVPFTSVSNSVNYHSWLPSLDANYRIKPNWSVYGQGSTGSVVPPSSVYDTAGALVGTPPKPQTSTTYQTGTVLKLKRVTFDADFYHIRFQNGYSSSTDNDVNSPLYGESIQFISPSSITLGGEFETSVALGHGLSLYLNATRGKATYVGTLTVNSPSGTNENPLVVKAPSGLWVAQTPTDTEAEGVTYQDKGWNVGVFNKRVGSKWEDNGAYHNQVRDDPYNVSNAYINYTVRGGSHFDQTKIRLSVNNLMGSHNITSVTPGGALVAGSLTSGGLTYTDPFVGTTTASPGFTGGRNLADNPNLLSGRSIILSVTFGFSPGR